MKITYLYKKRWNGEIKEIEFYSFKDFGIWIAGNITEIINIDCTIKEN